LPSRISVCCCSYNKGRTLDAFLEFIKEKLEADKGFARVAALDKLAQAFVADGADTAKVAADVKAAAAKVDKEEAGNAKLYVEAIEKALARVSLVITG
jgi:protein disulfide-isomerase A6